jgi:hypothetical protein
MKPLINDDCSSSRLWRVSSCDHDCMQCVISSLRCVLLIACCCDDRARLQGKHGKRGLSPSNQLEDCPHQTGANPIGFSDPPRPESLNTSSGSRKRSRQGHSNEGNAETDLQNRNAGGSPLKCEAAQYPARVVHTRDPSTLDSTSRGRGGTSEGAAAHEQVSLLDTPFLSPLACLPPFMDPLVSLEFRSAEQPLKRCNESTLWA